LFDIYFISNFLETTSKLNETIFPAVAFG